MSETAPVEIPIFRSRNRARARANAWPVSTARVHCKTAVPPMSEMGQEETRQPRDPRDRSSSVTGPRCGGRSGAPLKALRRGRGATTDQAQQPCRQAHGRGEDPRRPENWEGRR